MVDVYYRVYTDILKWPQFRGLDKRGSIILLSTLINGVTMPFCARQFKDDIMLGVGVAKSDTFYR